jgi:heme exporter protein D
MKDDNYIIEWFPKREFKHFTIQITNKKLAVITIILPIIGITFGLLPFFNHGLVTFWVWFGIGLNSLCLIYNLWSIIRVKKNVMKNGVPEKW